MGGFHPYEKIKYLIISNLQFHRPIRSLRLTAEACGMPQEGSASADVVERQRGFQGKPKQRSHRPQHREGRVPLKGAVSKADWG